MADQKKLSPYSLSKKQKPQWQTGHLNAVGGKIESGELPIQAIEREFFEETGLALHSSIWKHFATLLGIGDVKVMFFYATSPSEIGNARSVEEEKVHVINVSGLREFPHLYNLPWLIRMAQESRRTGSLYQIVENGESGEPAISAELQSLYDGRTT